MLFFLLRAQQQRKSSRNSYFWQFSPEKLSGWFWLWYVPQGNNNIIQSVLSRWWRTRVFPMRGIADSPRSSWIWFLLNPWLVWKDHGKAVVNISHWLKSPHHNFSLASHLENGSQTSQDRDDCCGHLKIHFTNKLPGDLTKEFSGNAHYITQSVYSTSNKALIMH